MTVRLEGGLRIVGVYAVLLTVGAHLLWLYPRLSWALVSGPIEDTRPYLFVVAVGVLSAAAVAVFEGARYRRLHALVIGTLGSLLVGFLLHEGTKTIDALVAEPLAIVAKAAEIVGIVAFVGLYRLHHPDRLEGRSTSDADTDDDR
ncbi:MAG: hypothetical protein ACQETB_06445 [Halobacteriota archaeon]